jgi:hypothetical protein
LRTQAAGILARLAEDGRRAVRVVLSQSGKRRYCGGTFSKSKLMDMVHTSIDGILDIRLRSQFQVSINIAITLQIVLLGLFCSPPRSGEIYHIPKRLYPRKCEVLNYSRLESH